MSSDITMLYTCLIVILAHLIFNHFWNDNRDGACYLTPVLAALVDRVYANRSTPSALPITLALSRISLPFAMSLPCSS